MGARLSVLFVCTANRCRSPFMELWARHALGPGSSLDVASAGTHAHAGEPVSPEMHPPLERDGVDVAAFRSRPVTARLVADADLVLTAEARHRALLLDDDPTAFGRVLTLGQAAEAARHLPAGTHGAEALAALARRRPATDGRDVADPWGGGGAAAEECATTVTSMLGVLLPVLTGRPVPTPGPPTPET